MKTTRQIVEKADIAVSNLISDGGYLQPEQSNTFINQILDEPTILKQMRTVRMSTPQIRVNKIGFYDRILKNAPASGIALPASERSKPSTSQIQMSTQEVIAEVNIPYDVLEDNIERGGLESHIMTLIGQRVAVDLEERVILSDTSDAALVPELRLFDGLIRQISNAPADNRFSAGHVVALADDGTNVIGKTAFKKALKAMPPKYIRQRNQFRFWTSFVNEIDYRDSLATRQTVLGDSMIEAKSSMTPWGVPLEANAWVPESNIILTHPQNLIWGVQRDIMIETDKDIRERVLIIVLTMRIDFKIEEPEACVLVTGLEEGRESEFTVSVIS